MLSNKFVVWGSVKIAGMKFWVMHILDLQETRQNDRDSNVRSENHKF